MAKGGNKRSTKLRKRGRKTSHEFKGNQYTKKRREEEENVCNIISNDSDVGGNDYSSDTEAVPGPSTASETSSASARKLQLNAPVHVIPEGEIVGSHYILIDSDMLSEMIGSVGQCQAPNSNCKGKVLVTNSVKEKRGLSCKLHLQCSQCEWSTSYYTRKELPSSKRGRKKFDINVRTVAAFREIGKGHTAIETVCGFLNMCPPMNR